MSKIVRHVVQTYCSIQGDNQM